MALTINGIDTNDYSVRFAHDDLVLTLSETVTYAYRWQFVLQIYDDTGLGSPQLITTMKAPPNESTCAPFNVNRVVRAMCRKKAFDLSDWDSATGFSNGETGITVQFQAYNEYATTANGPLQTTTPVSATLKFVDGGDQLDSYTAAVANVYRLSAASGRMLTRRTDFYVRASENGGLGFVINNTWGSNPNYLHVAYFDASGTALNAGSLSVPNTYDDDTLLSYAWVYPISLAQQSANTSISPYAAGNVGWAYYQVQFTNSITNTPGFERSRPYTFHRIPECAMGNRELLFYFQNSLGAYETFRFTGKIIRRNEVERSEYTQSRGNWSTANALSGFTYSRMDRGRKQLIKKRKTVYECHTGLLTDQDNYSIMELLYSRSVFINPTDDNSGGLLPCIVQTTDQVVLEQDFDPMITYTFTVELSIEQTTPQL